MDELQKVWNYLIAIGFLPLAICMSLAIYGLGRWYYGINDFFLKETSIKADTEENIAKMKSLDKALKIIKALPMVLGMAVTIAMQYKQNGTASDIIISGCLGLVHAFIGVMVYETLIEFKIFKKLEARFIKTGE